MQRESNWRHYFTAIVTVLCLLFIFPTLRYVHFLYTNPVPERVDYESDPAWEEAVHAYESDKQDLQDNAIKLGLDLVGGVDVLLQIDEAKTRADRLNFRGEELLRLLNEKQIDAQISLNTAGDRLAINLDDKANARQVANLLDERVKDDVFDSYDVRDFEATGKTELALTDLLLRRYINDAIESAEKKIRERVDTLGVTQASVSRQADTNSIRVQIPGERDPERVIAEVIRPAQLEFYPLYRDGQNERAHDNKVAELFERVEWDKNADKAETIKYIKAGEEKETFFGWKLKEGARLPAGYIALAGKPLTPAQRAEADMTNPVGNLYIVKRHADMDGKTLRDAQMRTNPASLSDPIYVSLTFDRKGARLFHRLSTEYLHERVAIALDRKVYSAPVFQSIIPNGQAQITGRFSAEEAHSLALVLKAGALPADLKPVEKRAIGPTLGVESIVDSTYALMIGGIAITVFMILYYGTAGLISIIALALNILVIVACLDLFNATLTLSGIGGMILTLGMAVDANVLIYERIREEVLAGRPLVNAIRSGFGRAFSVILDSNLTTLLAAFALLQFGEGTVQGFALTMAFGLLANLFTGLTVTYALCTLWFNLRGKLSLGVLHIFRNPKFDFIAARYVTFPLSAIIVAGSAIFLIARGGPEMAVDFRGGVLTEVGINAKDEQGNPIEGDQSEPLRRALEQAGLGGDQAKVQKVRGEDKYLIRLGLQSDPSRPGAPGAAEGDVTHTQAQIENVLRETYPEDQLEILSTTSVSKEVGQGFREIAVVVVIAASVCILAYLWLRFELIFGLAAVIALVHDLTFTLGVITLLDIQISLDIVSALLILLGFSVNDTIVIFDRVRENSHTMFGRSFKEICNDAMNRSLSRTIITSLTTIGIMSIMYLFGGHSLAPFAMTLIVGAAVGTYSSDFVAAPFVFWWNERQKGKLVEHLGRKGPAARPAETQPAMAGAAAAPASAGARSAGGGSGARRPRRGGRR